MQQYPRHALKRHDLSHADRNRRCVAQLTVRCGPPLGEWLTSEGNSLPCTLLAVEDAA